MAASRSWAAASHCSASVAAGHAAAGQAQMSHASLLAALDRNPAEGAPQ